MDTQTLRALTEQARALKQNPAWVDLIASSWTRWCEHYRDDLARRRSLIQQAFPKVTHENIDAVQNALTESYRELFVSWHDQALDILRSSLGEPPCEYAWVGLGSFSRGEVLPYSDLEYIFLFEPSDLATRGYFWALLQLLTFQAHSLNEPDGLHPDQYPEVEDIETIPFPLPRTLQGILSNLKTACRAPTGVYTQIISALQGRILAGEPSLWKSYVKELQKMNWQPVFKEIILVSVNDYEKTWKTGVSVHAQKDAKEGYGYFLTYLAVMLKFYHTVEGDSTEDIVKGLVVKGVCCEDVGGRLRQASRRIQALRYQTQAHYRASDHRFSLDLEDNSGAYRLNPQEINDLEEIRRSLEMIYNHLSAAKRLSIKPWPDLTQIPELTNAYNSIKPPLFRPNFNQDQLQTQLHACLNDRKMVKLSLPGLLFLIELGARADIPGLAGLTPMRKVLIWANDKPKLAFKTWTLLLKAKGSLEEIHNGDRLIDQAMNEKKVFAFLVLGQLGAGRESNGNHLLNFIREQFSSPTLSNDLRTSLQAALPTLMLQNPLLNWFLTLDCVKQESKTEIQLEGVKTPPGFLSLSLLRALFKDKDHINSVNTYGRREVAYAKITPLINVYAKFYPELPGLEEAVKQLALGLFEVPPIPYSELFAFEDQNNRYPVLLSQAVPGDNFQTILNAVREKDQKALSKIQVIDGARFSELFLLSVLIHPEDGKPDNFILSPFKSNNGKSAYALIGIDNDHALVPTFKGDTDDVKSFQIKTIVFTLDQMQLPLDLKVVKTFLQKDPETYLRSWLDKLVACQDRYESLFKPEVCAQLFKEESVPQMILPPNSVPKLYERWVRLKRTLENNSQVKAMDLLIQADPMVGLRYNDIFLKHHDPLSRFHAIASPAYLFSPKVGQYKTLVTSSQLLKSAKMTQSQVLQGQTYSPKQAKEGWYASLNQMNAVQSLAEGLSRGNIDAFEQISLNIVKESVLRQTDFKDMDEKTQRAFINICLDRECGLTGLDGLTLLHFSALKSKELNILLERSPRCHSLQLIGLHKLEQYSWLNEYWTLSELRILKLQEVSVKNLVIHSPKLHIVIIKGLKTCKRLTLPETKNLKSISIQDCPALKPDSLMTLLVQNPGLPIDQLNIQPPQDKNTKKDWIHYIQMVLGQSETSNETIWHICHIIHILGLKKVNLDNPEKSFIESLYLASVLIYLTEVHTLTYQTTSFKKTVDLQALRRLKGQSTLDLFSEIQLEWLSNDTAIAFKKVTQDLDLKENTSPLHFDGLVPLLLSLQPVVVNLQLSILSKPNNFIMNVLLSALKDKDSWHVRTAAANVLGQLDHPSSDVIEALLIALRDMNCHVRASAASALGQLGGFSPDVIEALVKASRDEVSYVRSSAVRSLGQLGEFSPVVIKALVCALNDDRDSWTGDVRETAAEALEQLGQSSPEVTEALLYALRHTGHLREKSVISVLGQIGQSTPDVIQELLPYLGDKDVEVQASAAISLSQLGHSSPALITPLVNALKLEDHNTRISAANVLGQLGQSSSDVMEALLIALRDSNFQVRTSAASSLLKLDPSLSIVLEEEEQTQPEDVWKSSIDVATALKSLHDQNPKVRRSAASDLGDFGIASPEIVEALVKSLRDEDTDVRTSASCSLVQLGRKPMDFSQWFRFQPAMKTMVLKSNRFKCNIRLLILGLMETNGKLMQIQIRSQPMFDLHSLRVLNGMNWANSTQLLPLIIEGDPQALVLIEGFLRYIFKCKVLNIKIMGAVLQVSTFQQQCVEILKALKIWLSKQPQIYTQHVSPTKSDIIQFSPDSHQSLLNSDQPPLTIITTETSKIEKSNKNMAKCAHVFPAYLTNFKKYQESLLAFLQKKTLNKKLLPSQARGLIQELIAISPQSLDLCTLIEALDWLLLKIEVQANLKTSLEKNLQLAKSFSAWGGLPKKPSDWLELMPLLKQYALLCKTQALDDPSACFEHDTCLILWAYAVLVSEENAPSQATFLKNLKVDSLFHWTGQHVYNLELKGLIQLPSGLKGLKKPPLHSLFKNLLRAIPLRLPLDVMEAELVELEKQMEIQSESYKALVQACIQHQTQSKTISKGWRWRFLGLNSTTPERCYGKNGVTIHAFFHLKHVFNPKIRFVSIHHPDHAIIIGSTYFNWNKPFDEETTLCLDANYQFGATGATADGYGHYKEPAENKKVQTSAYQTVKRITRYVSLYSNLEQLILDIQGLFQYVGHSVKYSFLHPEEAGTTSCVFTRIFETSEGPYLVAAGIGDGLVAVFDPNSGLLQTLIKPRQYRRGKGPFTPLSITEDWARGRVQVYHGKLSKHSFIFRMTDGAWEALPFLVSTPLHDSELITSYLEYSLDDKILSQSIQTWLSLSSQRCTASDLCSFMQDKIQTQIESTQQYLIKEKEDLQPQMEDFLSQQGGSSKATLKEFINAMGEQWRKRIRDLVIAMKLDIFELEDKQVADLLAQMQQMGLGDDLTLHIQSI